MEIFYRATPFTLKHLQEAGNFWGYASTSCVDLSQDQILPGAFKKSLKSWKMGRGRWPHLYAEHDTEEFVGICQDLREDETGLYVRGKLFLEIPKAKEIYDRLQGGGHGLSIGFFAKNSRTQGSVRQIVEIDLREISFVQNPCNPEARVKEFKQSPSWQDLLPLLQRATRILQASYRAPTTTRSQPCHLPLS